MSEGEGVRVRGLIDSDSSGYSVKAVETRNFESEKKAVHWRTQSLVGFNIQNVFAQEDSFTFVSPNLVDLLAQIHLLYHISNVISVLTFDWFWLINTRLGLFVALLSQPLPGTVI
jgi:hypothetical protein